MSPAGVTIAGQWGTSDDEPDTAVSVGYQQPLVDTGEAFSISLQQATPLRELARDSLEHAQPECRVQFAHLAVEADGLHRVGAVDAEISQIVDSGFHGRIATRQRAAFGRVKQLGGVKAEHGGVAKAADAGFSFFDVADSKNVDA